jgi:hypothetical protein
VVTRGTLPPPRSSDIDTGKLMMAGLSLRGPIDRATESHSLAEWVSQHGTRDSTVVDYDAIETYFREGGARLLYARVGGPSAAKAVRNLLDGASAVAIVATARGVGSYGNAITVQVTHPTGSTFQLIVVGTNGDGTALTETSPEFATTADAVTWGSSTATTGFTLITLTQGASALDPAVLAASVLGNTTSGADDRASITVTEKAAALALFTRDLGPGQVAYAGATDATTHALVESHVEDMGRVGLLSAPDSATVGTVTGVAASDRAVTGARSSALFAPWVTVPPLTPGASIRTVPPAIVAAALMARSDGAGNTPNRAAAADNGRLQWSTGLSQLAWTDTQRATLSDAGVNVFRPFAGGYELYDNVTLADPLVDVEWTELGNARFFSLIRARAQVALEQFEFEEIDGPYPQGHIWTRVRSALTDVVAPYFPGSLFGTTFSDACLIDLSGNTVTTIAAKKVLATLAVKMSPGARRVELTIVKAPLSATLA